MLFYNNILFHTIFFEQFNQIKVEPILIEIISNFLEWKFSVRFYYPIMFSSVRGVKKDGLPDLSSFSTVPR
jgi:hypothetical protein